MSRPLPLCWFLAALALWLGDAAPAKAQLLPPTQLYLHTDGLELNVSFQTGRGCMPGIGNCGISDARSNTSWLPNLRQRTVTIPPMDYERYGAGKALVSAALLAQVQELLRGINLKVVNKRPKPGTRYSMVVVGGDPSDIGLAASIAGLAPLDCQDQNPWDITFVFSDTLSTLDAVARVTVQEAAHSYGIEHVRADDYVMNPEPIGGAMGLGKSCLPLDPSPGLSNPDGIKCLHACEEPSYQNSFAELQALFGATPIPRSAYPPKVQIVYPEQGNHFFEHPLNLRLKVDVINPEDLTHVELSVNDGPPVRNSMYPYSYRLHRLLPGKYQAKVTAHDIHGNQSSSQVDFSVGAHGASSQDKPKVAAEQISLRIDRLSGEPVRCSSDRACYGGTTCQQGLCLRPLPAAGCSLKPRRGTGIYLALLLLLGFRAGSSSLRRKALSR